MLKQIIKIFEDRTEYRNEKDQLHREDGPAIEYDNGDKEWYLNGLRHREDGPAQEWPNGSKFWYQNGLRHRIDGPAIERKNGSFEWYQNGLLHREDGPAIKKFNGYKEWWLHNRYMSEEVFNQRTKVMEISISDLERQYGCKVKIIK